MSDKVQPVFVVVPNATGTKVSEFTSAQESTLFQLEKKRQAGQLKDKSEILKWKKLYAMYQSYLLHCDQKPSKEVKENSSKISQETPKSSTPPEILQKESEKIQKIEKTESLISDSTPISYGDSFTIFVNSVPYSLTTVDPRQSLLSFLRSLPNTTGTKKGCGEGGCGACTVMLIDGKKSYSVNSCLRPLVACQGMNVITIEGIGNSKIGLNQIQKVLADNAGTQCGFCSPGFVMEMYSLLTHNPTPTADEVEKYFDGNLCRCTGYRPIYTAFKTFASPGEPEKKNCSGVCSKSGKDCSNKCKLSKIYPDIEELAPPKPEKYEHKAIIHDVERKIIRKVNYAGVQWFTPTTLPDVYQLLATLPTASTSLVFGHTSWGIYKDWTPLNFIDLQYVTSLKGFSINSNNSVTFGACNTIAEFLDILDSLNALSILTADQKCIFPDLIYIVKRVASHQIRNAGSIGGNLMLANKHSFPSDLIIALMGLNATVIIGSGNSEQTLNIGDFVVKDMTGMLLKQIIMPLGKSGQIYRTFKVAQRNAYSHSFVNGGLSAVVTNNKIVGLPVIAFGNIRSKQSRMSSTENFLVGKDITSPLTLQSATSMLFSELNPDTTIPDTNYRVSLAISMFYKFYLSLVPSQILPSNLTSAINRFVRGVTRGEQVFDTNPGEYPVSAPIPKLGGRLQTSGEAQYTGDIPFVKGTLHGAFVISSVANATVSSIDPSPALAVPGVISWISVEDIPGNPVFSAISLPLFARTISYNGQPLGMIVAIDEDTAQFATKLVVVNYVNSAPPICTIQQAIAASSFWPSSFPPISAGNVDQGLKESDVVFSGNVSLGGQYHLHLETQTCLATPLEDGHIRLDAATQDTDTIQATASSILNIPRNKIEVHVKRCGGGYGGKLANACYITSATAVAASKFGLPVRAVMDLETNLRMLGRRPDYYVEYTVGIKAGKLNALKIKSYVNSGATNNETAFTALVYNVTVGTVYYCPNFYSEVVCCKTNIPPMTSVRGPGWTPATFITEHIVEHAASFLGVPPHVFKRGNLYTKGQTTPDGSKLVYFNMDLIFDQLRATSDFDARYQEIQQYNQQNKWTKRGISMVPVRFGVGWAGSHFTAMISVYGDGSITVYHAGVEIGQGIDTKVSQAVAYRLGVPLDIITVGRHSSITSPNVTPTGGSITSGLNSQAALNAADILNSRLAPIKTLLGPKATWVEIVQKAISIGVDLQAIGSVAPGPGPNSPWFQYMSYSCIVQEVFVDILTGEHQLLRSDILYDAGISLNPTIDIGQIEGGFAMGLGLFLTEQIEFDQNGAPLQYNTWEYKPLTGYDISLDLRVALLKNAPNPVGVLSSKASGEPPLSLSCSALFAIQNAVADYRKSSGKDIKNFSLNSPATPANVSKSAEVSIKELML